jgi:hypothetical protein
VADRLVDLQGHLAPVEHHRRGAGRALVGRQQLQRLVGHPGGGAHEVEPPHELVAHRAAVAAEGVRVRPLLDLGLAHRGGVDARPALGDVLGDVGALARQEQRAAAPGVVAAPAEGDAGHRHQRAGGLDQEPDLVLEGHGEGVLGHLVGPRGPHGLDPGQSHGVGLQEPAGPPDLDRPPGGRLHVDGIEASHGGEAPGAVGHHPHPDARRVRALHALHLAVADPEVLGGELHHPGVGVRGAGVGGHGDGAGRQLAQVVAELLHGRQPR